MENPIVIEDLERIHLAVQPGDQFRGSIVVMTGCAGFLGFYMMNYFVRYADTLGVRKVIGLDTFLLAKPDWLQGLERDFPGILELTEFDISTGDIGALPDAKEATYVVHAASVASPSFYRKYPVQTVDANIWGLRRLLDFYRDSSLLKGFLFFSSSEIYGDPDPAHIPTDEEYCGRVSCTGPRACYDESKRFGETICWIYAREYGMPLTIARPFNNYGPGMRLDDRRLPADLANCIVRGEDIVILSDGRPTRTFCYVTDAVAGYIRCLLHGRYDYFNIGMDRPEISVLELASLFQAAGRQIFGYSGSLHYKTSEDPEYMTHNPNRRCPVIAKAREKLGYDPAVLVGAGVERFLRYLQHEAT